MRRVNAAVLVVMVLLVSACTAHVPAEQPGVQQSMQRPGDEPETTVLRKMQALQIEAIEVTVPRSLSVSEANVFVPRADIVWRGDPPGDRYAQVQEIFETGLALGTQSMQSGLPAVLEVTVTRFHSVTERTRYTASGNHSIHFTYRVREAVTGVELIPERALKADLRAYGGVKAIEAERAGITQKVRIVDHLAKTIRQELSYPIAYFPPGILPQS